MNNVLKTLFIIIILIAILLLGYFIGRTPVLEESVSEDIIKKQFLEELRNNGYLLPLPEFNNILTGKTLIIEKDNIRLSVFPDKGINILGVFYPKELDIIINDETKFVITKEKDLETFKKEDSMFQEIVAEYSKEGKDISGLKRPDAFYYEEVTNIEIDNFVYIIVDKNVLETQNNLIAKEIRIMDEVSKYLPQ